jgi:hypothetical protein
MAVLGRRRGLMGNQLLLIDIFSTILKSGSAANPKLALKNRSGRKSSLLLRDFSHGAVKNPIRLRDNFLPILKWAQTVGFAGATPDSRMVREKTSNFAASWFPISPVDYIWGKLQ